MTSREIRILRLKLWCAQFWPLWHAIPRYRVVIRQQRPLPGSGWQPYYAYVNHIQGGIKRLLGPVEHFSIEEALNMADGQAHEILFPEDFPRVLCVNCDGYDDAQPHHPEAECSQCGRKCKVPVIIKGDARRWKQPPNPHGKSIRLLDEGKARIECACGWMSDPVSLAEAEEMEFQHKIHVTHEEQERAGLPEIPNPEPAGEVGTGQ